MSKGFKGKTCAYCGRPGSSNSRDHIFARQFFPVEKRANLPTVPACDACNNEKSGLETYLAAVLPFGGAHADASQVLNEMVPKRLAKNAKLHLQLAAGQSHAWVERNGILVPQMTLPIDAEKLAALFGYVVRGLAVYHWDTLLPSDCNVRAGMVTAFGDGQFRRLLELNGNRVVGDWGDGAFQYEAVQSVAQPWVTVWNFKAYGGAALSGDPQAPGEVASTIWVTTSRSAALASVLDAEGAYV